MRRAALALCVLAAAGAASAQPPPADRSQAGIDRWLAENIVPGDYSLLEAADGRARYFHVVAVQDMTAPVIRGWLRIEYFDPPGPARAYRSVDQLFDFDCVNLRVRALAYDTYAQLNRRGGMVDGQDLQDPRWTYARSNEPLELALDQACRARARAIAARTSPRP